jgi:hypothetical protein
MATVLEAGRIPSDTTRVRVANGLAAALEDVEGWRDLPVLDRKAYGERLTDAAKHLRVAALRFKSAQPEMHKALNRTVRRRLFEYFPTALIQRLVPAMREYRPSPRDLESRAWREGNYEAWSHDWRWNYLGEHGAQATAKLLTGLADGLDQQIAIDKASASRGGAPGHPERDRLIAHLIALWEHHLGRPAKSTPAGAFVAFANAVCAELGWGDNHDTRIRRVLSKYRRAQAERFGQAGDESF